MSDWLELELSHRLAPTTAPEDLWDLLQTAPPAAPPRRNMWPVAAVLTVMAAAGTLWIMVAKGQEPMLDLRQLAARQLGSQQTLDIRTRDAREIAAWARREAGVDLPLSPSPAAELVGARLIRHRGECIAAISYRIDGREAALLVARASTSEVTPHGGMSWQHGGQSYALASSDSSRADAACRLCHSSL